MEWIKELERKRKVKRERGVLKILRVCYVEGRKGGLAQ